MKFTGDGFTLGQGTSKQRAQQAAAQAALEALAAEDGAVSP